MARKPVFQATRRVFDDAVAAIEARLPRAWKVDVASRSTEGGSLRFTSPDEVAGEVPVCVRREVSPRAAVAMGAPGLPTIVASSWLSPRTREVLNESGWSYIDTTGNAHLSIDRPGLFLRTDGAPRDPSPKRSTGPNLRGPRAWALQRTLVEVLPPYGVTELSTARDIDPGYVSRLLGALSDELLIDRPARGRVQTVQWEPLLRQIATSYSLLGSNETANWVAPGGAEQFLRDLSLSKLKRWAVTGSFAASRLVSVTAPEIAVVFTEDPERIADTMRLRPVRNGGNVVTALPYDRIVFERTWKADDIVFTSIAQIVMDCTTGFGRMPAEADALLDRMRRRAPQWQAGSLSELAKSP
ncbi:MAG: hypothetical protein HY826_08295 [Actinobacteria bacterium]|nr:hypothetical protein [Actinomycetota bacterium]